MAKKEKKKRSFWEGFFTKLPWIVAFSIFFMILSLKAMERFPIPLKEGFENYFSNISGQTASIGVLRKSQFFPSLYIQMEDILLSQSENVAQQSMSIQKAQVHVPFVSMFIGGREFYNFGIEELKAEAKIFTDHPISIEKLSIIDSEVSEKQASLSAIGQYANQPMEASIDLKRSKTLFGSIVYKIPRNAEMSMSIGNVSINGQVVTRGTNIFINDGTIKTAGNTSVLRGHDVVIEGTINKDNIISCLLAQDYKNVNNICLDYVLEDADEIKE
ncbi:MAG: hypothetical protein HRT94_06375 [Alphaproteobacteria bacterium]|nr:hypothetical protein [Alphaproteobacteria bacterium]